MPGFGRIRRDRDRVVGIGTEGKVLEIGHAAPGSGGMGIDADPLKIALLPIIGKTAGIAIGGGERIGASQQFVAIAHPIAIKVGSPRIGQRTVSGAPAKKTRACRGTHRQAQRTIISRSYPRQITPFQDIRRLLKNNKSTP